MNYGFGFLLCAGPHTTQVFWGEGALGINVSLPNKQECFQRKLIIGTLVENVHK